MVHKMKPVLPWLTKDIIQHRLKRHRYHHHHHHERGGNNHEEDRDSEFMEAEEENTTTDVNNNQVINEESNNHCINTAGSTPTCNRDLVGRVMVVEPSHTEEALSLLTRSALTHQPLKMETWVVRNFYVRQRHDHK